MPRYSLEQLIARQNSGQIGYRGLRRLAQLQASLAPSGVDPGLAHDPEADLNARRTALYAHAVEAAHNLQPGQTLSAGLQRRLSLGAPGTMGPRSTQGVQAFQGDNYNTILDALRKRSQGVRSSAGIYRF
jgi:hypothetical protein